VLIVADSVELLFLAGGSEQRFVNQQPVNHLFHVPAVACLLCLDVGWGRYCRYTCSRLPFVNLVDSLSDFGVLAQLPLDGRVRLPLQCHPNLYTDPPLRLAAYYPPDSFCILKSVYVLGFLQLLSSGAIISAVSACFAIPFFVISFASFASFASFVCLAA
jgi:hypothetical protein